MKLPLLSVLVVGVLLGMKPAHAQVSQAASEGQQVSAQGEIPDALVQTDEDLDGRGGGFHGPGRFVPPRGGGGFHWGGVRAGGMQGSCLHHLLGWVMFLLVMLSAQLSINRAKLSLISVLVSMKLLMAHFIVVVVKTTNKMAAAAISLMDIAKVDNAFLEVR
jgi:hypothetical protein